MPAISEFGIITIVQFSINLVTVEVNAVQYFNVVSLPSSFYRFNYKNQNYTYAHNYFTFMDYIGLANVYFKKIGSYNNLVR